MCKCGCGLPLPASKGRGRPAEYARDTCRVRAFRQRRAGSLALQDLGGVPSVAAGPARGRPASSDEQVARTLLETRGIAGTWLRLGHEARPQFAWRSEKLGTAIASAIDDYFGGIF